MNNWTDPLDDEISKSLKQSEMKEESRTEILDRLAKKWGQKVEGNCRDFNDFCFYFDGEAVTKLVRQAMQEYANQWHRIMKSKN